eukprot:gnl/TRDRNA2_/TRDRNA2_204622_c0_seq1.p1 gnl/TRDRNA2_/TRDRNA2_204622_c0~~gnl/TRDRNA2_/TRDRNA2_204622_c0_seq1.p1  ORF type:complete len:294 (-),score=44.22 gnl/TRDRNA2_/TRDRNA2_204622_c0_seq1:238-1119(-)
MSDLLVLSRQRATSLSVWWKVFFACSLFCLACVPGSMCTTITGTSRNIGALNTWLQTRRATAQLSKYDSRPVAGVGGLYSRRGSDPGMPHSIRATSGIAARKFGWQVARNSGQKSWGDTMRHHATFQGQAEGWKMVMCVREDLGMSVGKAAAQVGHAVHAALRESQADLSAWESTGSKKVVLGVGSEAELLELQRLAQSLGLVAVSIMDAGHTELQAGTTTVVAIGPAREGEVNRVTGHLQLLPDIVRQLDRENQELRAFVERVRQKLDDEDDDLALGSSIRQLLQELEPKLR